MKAGTQSTDLMEVALAIGDGAVVDWGRVESRSGEAERRLVRDLRLVEQVASLHASLPPAAAFERSLHDSLWRSAAVADASHGEAPATWGPLTIIELIGRGTYADVYRARDPRLDRSVALKLLRHRQADDTALESEVIEEARLLARVEHPNVVAVYGADRIDGRVGIWMAFVEGRTLDQELRDGGPFAPGEVARVGIALCGALGAVHKAGLLHRDVKAQNVLRDREGRVLLADFGTGREVAQSAPANELAGTPLYLAPEVLRGEGASAASDIYSLGVLLYHLSTGSFPVCGRSLFDLRDNHARGVRTLLGQGRPGLPRRLAAAIDRATSLDPATRFQTVSELEKALTTVGLHPRPLSAWAVGLAASLLVVGVAAWLFDAGGWRHRWQAAASQGVGPSPPSTPLVHRTRLPEGAAMGPPSRDGRLFPYVDDAGNIAVFDVATGQSRRLTAAATSIETGRSALMSPRGDRVVYEWAAPNHAFELRVADADGSWSGVLVSRSTAFEPVPLDWSRDGRQILCRFQQRNGTADLVLVPAEPGDPRVLVSLAGTIGRGTLSPDGRFVAYYATPKGAPGSPAQKSLYFVATDGSPPRLLMAASKDGSPSWTPDGTSVFFVRDGFPARPTDGWVVPVTDGVAGTPRMVAPNLGLVQDVAITDSGALSYVKGFVAYEVYTAPIDLSGGPNPGVPTRISATNLDHHVSPTWSPDGTKVAYFVLQPHPYGYRDLRILTIKDVQSGREQALHPALSFLGSYPAQWLPDGRTLIVWGRDLDETHPDRMGYYRVDAQTSETRPVVLVGPLDGPSVFRSSRDGRALLYVDPKRGIVAHELATGRETIRISLVPGSSFYVFGESPTDDAIAFASCADSRCVLNVQVGDGPPRVLVSSPTDDISFQGWTPDGRQILYTRDPRATALAKDTLVDLRVTPVTGGLSRSLHVPIFVSRGGRVDLRPDGRSIAYTEQDSFPELWARDGVFPRLTAANPRVNR